MACKPGMFDVSRFRAEINRKDIQSGFNKTQLAAIERGLKAGFGSTLHFPAVGDVYISTAGVRIVACLGPQYFLLSLSTNYSNRTDPGNAVGGQTFSSLVQLHDYMVEKHYRYVNPMSFVGDVNDIEYDDDECHWG